MLKHNKYSIHSWLCSFMMMATYLSFVHYVPVPCNYMSICKNRSIRVYYYTRSCTMASEEAHFTWRKINLGSHIIWSFKNIMKMKQQKSSFNQTRMLEGKERTYWCTYDPRDAKYLLPEYWHLWIHKRSLLYRCNVSM